MKLVRALWVLAGLAAAGAGSWGLYYAGALGAAAALRLGGGLGAGVVLLAVLPALWPGVARRSALEAALSAPPPPGPARPRSLRDLEVTLRLAASRQGGQDVYFRLRPLLRRVAERRLRAGRLVELDAEPVRAKALLGDELWELLRPDASPPAQGARGAPVSTLAEWVERLEGL